MTSRRRDMRQHLTFPPSCLLILCPAASTCRACLPPMFSAAANGSPPNPFWEIDFDWLSNENQIAMTRFAVAQHNAAKSLPSLHSSTLPLFFSPSPLPPSPLLSFYFPLLPYSPSLLPFFPSSLLPFFPSSLLPFFPSFFPSLRLPLSSPSLASLCQNDSLQPVGVLYVERADIASTGNGSAGNSSAGGEEYLVTLAALNLLRGRTAGSALLLISVVEAQVLVPSYRYREYNFTLLAADEGTGMAAHYATHALDNSSGATPDTSQGGNASGRSSVNVTAFAVVRGRSGMQQRGRWARRQQGGVPGGTGAAAVLGVSLSSSNVTLLDVLAARANVVEGAGIDNSVTVTAAAADVPPAATAPAAVLTAPGIKAKAAGEGAVDEGGPREQVVVVKVVVWQPVPFTGHRLVDFFSPGCGRW
ncbi:unnamed protein product [Closterium sp. NIES-65]|nr:unnamed protein product [Closterium sp. NIES-65]